MMLSFIKCVADKTQLTLADYQEGMGLPIFWTSLKLHCYSSKSMFFIL